MFRDGLLKARGQIAFVLALAISTGVIIYLEALDTEQRIQARVEEEIARRGAGPRETASHLRQVSAETRRAVATALRQAEEAYAASPTAPEAVAALLTALSTAVQTGLLSHPDALPRAEGALSGLPAQAGTPPPVLAAAMSASLATFPSLQGRIDQSLR